MHVKTFSQKFAATAETSEGDGDTREAEEAPVTIFGTFASTNRQQHRGYVKRHCTIKWSIGEAYSRP